MLNFDSSDVTGTGILTGILALLLPLDTVFGNTNKPPSSPPGGGGGAGGGALSFVEETLGGVIATPLPPVSEESEDSDEILTVPAICPPIRPPTPLIPVLPIFFGFVGVGVGVGGTGREGLKSSPLSKTLGLGATAFVSGVFSGGIGGLGDEEVVPGEEGGIYGPRSFKKPRGGVIG